MMHGPLAGLRVLEFSGMGPGPHAGMLLADFGAEVLTIDRAGQTVTPLVSRGKASLVLDLKLASDHAKAVEAIANADILIEGFRPGVMERLGLGPDEMTARNPRLIYARMTGWGQTGPLAQRAGHDINYIALTGALAAIGRADEPPPPPLNLVGDYGGGSLFLVLGVLAALHERHRSGLGQVIDAAIIDGTASLMAQMQGLVNARQLSIDRGASLLGGSAPRYRCYRCADGRDIAIGAIEPKFYRLLLDKLGLDSTSFVVGREPGEWVRDSDRMAERFLTRDRAAWLAMFEGVDVCAAPVLTLDEAVTHPHMRARGTYLPAPGGFQPVPAPRLSRTPGAICRGDPALGEGGEALLQRWCAPAEPG